MALKAEISAIVASMSPPTPPSFLFGTVDELNNLADHVSSFPAVFMLALQPVKRKFTVSSAIGNTYSVYMEFLFQVQPDATTDQCEVYDEQCEKLINEFLIRLKNYRDTNGQKVFLVDLKTNINSQQVFNKYDTNTFGRNLTMDLETTYNENVCL